MKTQIPKVPEAPAASATQKFAGSRDERQAAVAQARLREMAATSPQSKQLKALQSLAAAHSPLQRAIDVALVTDDDTVKAVRATGTVGDFKGGSAAGDEGWVGVEHYRAWYEIDNEDRVDSPALPNLLTTPERGHALGRQNGGNGGDPLNVFGQDGGTNNSRYKVFENQMRNDLNGWEDDVEVEFKCYLQGDDIAQGNVLDDAMSEEDVIDSDSN